MPAKERIKVEGETRNERNSTRDDDTQPDDTHHMRLGVREGSVLKTRTVELPDGTTYQIELRNAQHWHIVEHPEFGAFLTVDDFKQFITKRNKTKNA